MAKKRNFRKVGLFIFILAIAGMLYVKMSGPSSHSPLPSGEIEKTGAGGIVDFTEKGKKIHAAVDEAMKKNNLAVNDTKEGVKEIPRQKVEGIIRWHARQLLVKPSENGSAESLQQGIQAVIKNSGGQIFSSQPDQYQGLAALRFDIGFKDKIAGDEITFITDQLYLVIEKIPQTLQNTQKQTGNKGTGKMAIVIDDFGYNREPITAFANINRPLTFAVLPYRPFSNEAAAKGISSGHQVILHLPMEPLAQGEQSEKITITTNLKEEEISDITQKAIAQIPGLIGVNNHQGSRATADRRVMKAVLKEIKDRNLFFLDSRTNSQSIAAEMAQQMGIKTGGNELFLDNTDDVNAVKGKLRTAQDMAIRHGSVTVIGHARMNTATAVSEMIPELEASGIQLVFVSQLLK